MYMYICLFKVKQGGRGYAEEQKWIMERKMPSFEEYIIKSRITALMYVSFAVAVPGIKSATKEFIDWLLTEPQIFIAAADTGRLLDDLASHQVSTTATTMVLNSINKFNQ